MADPIDLDDLPDHPDGGVPDYVESIVGNELRIYAIRDRKRDVLRRLGARRSWLDWSIWVLHAPGDDVIALAPILGALRDDGFGFLDDGHGWPPAGLFDEAVDRGLLVGRYLRVVHGVNGRGRAPGPRKPRPPPPPATATAPKEPTPEELKRAEGRRKMKENKERQKALKKFPRHPDGGALDYVRETVGFEIRVVARRPESIRVLESLGAKRDLIENSLWRVPLPDPEIERLAAPFAALRDANVGFVWYEHSWPPSAIFDELVSRGLLTGDHLKVKLG